jgi:predicted NUDIX family NTP pyrophosphohydrolase
MATQSAGILLYRIKDSHIELFLVHPGGPFWQKKDLGAWTIPKGEFTTAEDALAAAKREFQEETGLALAGDFVKLSPVKQKAGKLIHAWAAEGDIDASAISSNSFSLEWPPKSGKWKEFPEVDKAQWFDVNTAKEKINPAQASFIDELLQKLR